MITLSSFAVKLLVAASAFLLAAVVRRVYFHALTRFPGPKLAAATYWYAAYYEVRKDGGFVEHIAELHKQYGPVVRTGPNDLHFNEPRAYSDIYSERFPKDPKLYGALHQDRSLFGMTDPRQAKIRRDIMSPLFSRRAILNLKPVVLQKVETLVSAVLAYQKTGEPVNMHRAYRSATLDIIIGYCFGTDYGVITTPNFRHKLILNWEIVFPLFHVVKNFTFIFPFMMTMAKISAWIKPPKDSGELGNIQKHLEKQVDAILANPGLLDSSEYENIYQHLMKPHPEKGQPDVPRREDLVEEAGSTLAAGSDTVGNTMTVGTFYILNDPRVRAKLVAELEEAWPDADVPMDFEVLEKLPFLTAVIKESLRLSHGVVHPAPRVVTHDSVIAGHHVPAGVVVAMGSTFMHYNEDMFPESHTFRPERWLQDGTSDIEVVAFSKGPRSCLGVNLAWCEMYLLFGYMFRKVDMTLHGTSIEDMTFRCHLTPTYRGRMLHCTVKSRS